MKIDYKLLPFIFAQYYGAECQWADERNPEEPTITGQLIGVDSMSCVIDTGKYDSECMLFEARLILKPIEELDENILTKIWALLELPENTHFSNEGVKNALIKAIQEDKTTFLRLTFNDVQKVGNLLRREGYAVPYDGLDLFEIDVAIRKS